MPVTAHHLPEAIDHRFVARAVERAIGSPPILLVQRPTKLPRVVFEARAGGRTAFFKAEVPNVEGDYALALEAWAMSRAAEAGLPVAEVLHLDCSEREFPFRFMVMSEVPGVPLEDAGLGWQQEAAVLREAGSLIWRLHRVHVRGFDRLDEEHYLSTGHVRGISEMWREATENQALSAVTYLARGRLIDGPETSALLGRLNQGSPSIPDLEDGRLLHGDFDPSHIFVDPTDAKLTGVVDFGDRESGDPEWELALFRVGWDDAGRLEVLLKGYEDAGGNLNRELIDHYTLVRLLRLIRRRHEAGRLEAVEQMKTRLALLLAPPA